MRSLQLTQETLDNYYLYDTLLLCIGLTRCFTPVRKTSAGVCSDQLLLNTTVVILLVLFWRLQLMEVILLKTIENVGFQGDLLKVADGYARNFLFPRTLAVPASAGAKKNLATQQEQQKQQAQKRYEADVQIANKLKAISPLVVEASVGDDGKLFGTITPKEVARLLEEKSGVTIDRKNLTIGKALNRVGAYDLEYRLSTLVKVALVVDITAAVAE